MARSSRRARGWVSICDVPAPPRSPAAVHRALRRARVARELGPALAPHLLDVRGGRDLRLEFRGSGWEAPLRRCEVPLIERLERVLGHPVDSLEITGRGVDPPPREATHEAQTHLPGNAAQPASSLAARLERLGRRLVERERARDGSGPENR